MGGAKGDFNLHVRPRRRRSPLSTGARGVIRILLVDDNLDHVQLALRALRAHAAWKVEAARLGAECLESLRDTAFDVVLLDYRLPDMTGLEVLREIRKLPRPPVVFLMTSQGSEEVAIEALGAGARGYVVKNADFGKRLAFEVEDWAASRKENA